MSNLEALFRLCGRVMTVEQVARIALQLDRGDGLLLFDNFCDVMTRFSDTELEEEILEKLEDKGRILKTELAARASRIVMILPLMILSVLFIMFVMIIDVYLMAQSFYRTEQKLKERVISYVWAITGVFDSLRPLPLAYLVPPMSWSFDLMALFTLEIDIEAGVSCSGMQAPMYLFMNFLVIGTLVVLFDSSIFSFLVLASKEYKQPPSRALCGAEELVVRGIFFSAARQIKTIMQLVLAKMLWSEFTPFWSEISRACESQVAGSESTAQITTSVLFWMLALPTLHLLLNTSVVSSANND